MEIWRHEVRRLGWVAPAAPALAVLVTIAGALLASGNGAERVQLSGILLTGLEALLPLAVALAAASVVAVGRARELHLSLPTRYAVVLGRRLALLGGATAAIAVVFTVAVWSADLWYAPTPLLSPLLWAPSAAWLTSLAILVGLLTRSLLLATTVPAGMWLVQQLLTPAFTEHDWLRPFYLFPVTRLDAYSGWVADRLLLVAVTVPLAVGAAVLLRQPERMLTEEEV
ncbi:hypothetical protein ACWDV4_20250 [Micromonospora sp. NPDC003197]